MKRTDLVDIVEAMLEKLEAGERIEVADVMVILKCLRHVGDEGAEERALVFEIENALVSKRGMDFLHSSRRLTALLRNHFDRDDEIVAGAAYPTLARLERKYCPKPVMNRLTRAAPVV